MHASAGTQETHEGSNGASREKEGGGGEQGHWDG